MGQFEKYSASDLGAIVIDEAVKRANIKSEDVEQVILGQVSRPCYISICQSLALHVSNK